MARTALILVIALLPAAAAAADTCIATPTSIDCSAGGTTTTTNGSTTVGTSQRPHWFQLATDPATGRCWRWSTTPPGLDADDPRQEPSIVATIATMPPCPGHGPATHVTTTTAVEARAWEVFRSFHLAAPTVALTPDPGIASLASHLAAVTPRSIAHDEILPDGSRLQVTASVMWTWIDWGDGTPPERRLPQDLRPFPKGEATHAYHRKTCPPDYRLEHPSGGLCHPTLASYPITTTFEWVGRYRHQDGWVALGRIDRRTTVAYEVVEVVGVLTGP